MQRTYSGVVNVYFTLFKGGTIPIKSDFFLMSLFMNVLRGQYLINLEWEIQEGDYIRLVAFFKLIVI